MDQAQDSVASSRPAASIRGAERGDAEAVVALWTQAYVTEGKGGRTDPYSAAEFLELTETADVFVAELDGAVVGVVALQPPAAPGRAVAKAEESELSRLAVVPTARRVGVGASLVAHCERRAREAGWPAIALWSRRYQGAAHALYEAHGYARTPERDSVDAGGHARVTFRLTLTQPLTTRLEGSIVTLEPLEERHLEALWEAARAPEIWRWLAHIGDSRDYFEMWFEASLEAARSGREGPFATRLLADDRVVGSSRYLNVRQFDRVVEIGWTWLHPSAWRGGANVEAKLLMLRHAFEALGCVRVEFKTDARNERSRAALAAIPAQFEGVLRNHMIVPDVGQRDSAYFSVIDSEWPEVEANLERRLARRRSAR